MRKIIATSTASCPAKAGHPVIADFMMLQSFAPSIAPWLLDHPLSRMMTVRGAALAQDREAAA